METTLTMAGHLAHAGAARVLCGTPAPSLATSPAATAAAALMATKGGHGTHQASAWAEGAIAETTTFVVLDRKNRPSRPLLELSP